VAEWRNAAGVADAQRAEEVLQEMVEKPPAGAEALDSCPEPRSTLLWGRPTYDACRSPGPGTQGGRAGRRSGSTSCRTRRRSSGCTRSACERATTAARSGPARGGHAPFVFPTVHRFRAARLCGRAEHFPAQDGGLLTTLIEQSDLSLVDSMLAMEAVW
jgi:hypothetical protein